MSLPVNVFRVLGFAVVLASGVAQAEVPKAYQVVANAYGIPLEVFYSVMMAESGMKHPQGNNYLPWPWTLNVELKPYFFDTQQEAVVALRQFLAVNQKARIAVGPGQIYLPSHGKLFKDPAVLLDPAINLHYAAKLLAQNFQWTLDQGKPNWWVAVGRYHTPSRPDLAIPYREAVYARCKKMSASCANYGAISRG